MSEHDDLIAQARKEAATLGMLRIGNPATLERLADALEAVIRDRDYMVINAEGLARSGGRLRERAEGAEVALAKMTENRNEWASRMMELASITQRAEAAEARLASVRDCLPEDDFEPGSEYDIGWYDALQTVRRALGQENGDKDA